MTSFSYISAFLLASLLSLGADASRQEADPVRSAFTQFEARQVQMRRPMVQPDESWSRIEISSQEDFNQVSALMKAELEKGRNVEVDIAGGRYGYGRQHISFEGMVYPDQSVVIRADKAVFYPSGKNYVNGDAYTRDFSYSTGWISQNGRDLSVWSKALQTDQKIEVVNASTKMCRLHYKGIKDQEKADCARSYIQVSDSWTSYKLKIDHIENEFIYFRYPSLAKSGNDYNINHEFAYSKKYPRFRLCNTPQYHGEVYIHDGKISLKEGLRAHECFYSQLIYVKDAAFKSLEFTGMSLIGSGKSDELIGMSKATVSDGIFIHGNSFKSSTQDVIRGISTDNITIYDNKFSACYANGVNMQNNAAHAQVYGNTFDDCGKDWTNHKCVICRGSDYYIGYNRFRNFGYCGISVGTWQGNSMTFPTYGIVEFNVLWYEQDYAYKAFEKLMMDSGAIYTSTQNQESIIRYNTICNYTGRRYNHGIYCDDGSFNIKIYGNYITNIPNGYCVGHRYVRLTQQNKERFSMTNEGNFLAYNIFDGTYQFEGTPVRKDNNCVKGTNIILCEASDAKVLTASNISFQAGDIKVVSGKSASTKRRAITPECQSGIDSLPCADKIMKCIESAKDLTLK